MLSIKAAVRLTFTPVKRCKRGDVGRSRPAGLRKCPDPWCATGLRRSRECKFWARASIIAGDVLQDAGVTPQICALTPDGLYILKEL